MAGNAYFIYDLLIALTSFFPQEIAVDHCVSVANPMDMRDFGRHYAYSVHSRPNHLMGLLTLLSVAFEWTPWRRFR